MRIRAAAPADVPAIQALHAGQQYPLPEFDRTVIAANVAERDGGVVGAVIAVRAAEIVLVLDRERLTPRFRLETVKALHADMDQRLGALDVDCGYCWLAPEYGRRFGDRLIGELGWSEPTWRCLQKKVTR